MEKGNFNSEGLNPVRSSFKKIIEWWKQMPAHYADHFGELTTKVDKQYENAMRNVGSRIWRSEPRPVSPIEKVIDHPTELRNKRSLAMLKR